MRALWHSYYWRVVGCALAGEGLGLILDELIHGPFSLAWGNHELIGLILFAVGLACIAKHPKGKD